MTVTFWAPDAPMRTIAPYKSEPDYTVEVSVLPELNLSSANAASLLRLLGMPEDMARDGGKIEVSQLDAFAEKIHEAMRNSVLRAPELEPAMVGNAVVTAPEHIGALVHEQRIAVRTGPLVISGGRDDSYLVRQLSRMLELVQAAKLHGYAICWG